MKYNNYNGWFIEYNGYVGQLLTIKNELFINIKGSSRTKKFEPTADFYIYEPKVVNKFNFDCFLDHSDCIGYTRYIGRVIKGIKPGDLVDVEKVGFCVVFTFNNELYLRNGYNEIIKYDNQNILEILRAYSVEHANLEAYDSIHSFDEHKYYKTLKVDESDFYIERVKE